METYLICYKLSAAAIETGARKVIIERLEEAFPNRLDLADSAWLVQTDIGLADLQEWLNRLVAQPINFVLVRLVDKNWSVTDLAQLPPWLRKP